MYSESNVDIASDYLVREIVTVCEQSKIACTTLYMNDPGGDRPISQTVFMLSIAINRAEHVYATIIIKHNDMLMCNHKIVLNIMLCLLNSTGHI